MNTCQRICKELRRKRILDVCMPLNQSAVFAHVNYRHLSRRPLVRMATNASSFCFKLSGTNGTVLTSMKEQMQPLDIQLMYSPLTRNAVRFSSSLSSIEYEEVADETLEALQDYFEKLFDEGCFNNDFDVEYSSGVLTIQVGGAYGTYVINKQNPNKQIWLSSPTSGPKRYDYVDGCWVYSHDGQQMHDLLANEFSIITQSKLDFNNLPHATPS